MPELGCLSMLVYFIAAVVSFPFIAAGVLWDKLRAWLTGRE